MAKKLKILKKGLILNYFETAVKAAKDAGKVLLDSLGNIKSVEFKAKNDLVTEIDFKSEEMIIKIIREVFPHHTILAEEGGESGGSSEYLWLVDPLDGTMNYTHTYPFFSISIALEHQGSIILGVVYDPVRDELFSAEVAGGAKLNGKEISPSTSADLKDSLLATGFLHEDKTLVEQNLKHFENFIWKARGVRRDGSAALDLCYVACGRYDGFWELGLHPWDMAAGAFIAQEAGCRVTNMSGGEFTTYKGEIVTSNNLIHDEMLEILAL